MAREARREPCPTSPPVTPVPPPPFQQLVAAPTRRAIRSTYKLPVEPKCLPNSGIM